MKVPERTGQWVEMARSAESDGEICLQAPNGIWAGWLSPLYIKEDDLATFLRSIGWQVVVPATAGKARVKSS